MVTRFSIKVIDKGYNKFVSEIKQLVNNPKVEIGIQQEDNDRVNKKGENDFLKNIDLMYKHEFGVGVPQRSVIRAGTDDNIDNAYNKINELYNGVIKGVENVNSMFEKLGVYMERKLKERFSKQFLLENSPITIATKGRDVPLVDTGQMRESFSHKVIR